MGAWEPREGEDGKELQAETAQRAPGRTCNEASNETPTPDI